MSTGGFIFSSSFFLFSSLFLFFSSYCFLLFFIFFLVVQATARAVRTLHDAQRHGGLLALAVSQFHFNWESDRNSITWFGQLLEEIHAVWPRFKLSCGSDISWTGAPPVDKVETLGRRFSAAVWQSRWLDRQLSVLSKKPKVSQQDFLLFHILIHFVIW